MSGTLEEFLAVLAAREIRLWVEEGTRLRFRGPKGALTPELAEELKARKDAILALLLASAAPAAIPRVPDAATYALSQAQWRLWVLMQMENSSAAYNVPLHLELTGPLQRAPFERAWTALVARHESLRTNFITVDGEPRQQVHAARALTIGYEDLGAEADPVEAARARGRAHAARPFDLGRDPLLRVALLRLGPAHHVVLLTLHHIVVDGTSFGILLREFAQLYEAFAAGQADPLPPLALQFRDFAAWQNAQLHSAALAPHRRYWHEQLGGELPVLELPLDAPRPPVQTFHGREHAFALDRARLDGLLALAQSANASLFMVLTALVKVMLHRHTAQTDIVVGSPIAGRGHPDLEHQVGYYLNTLVLRDRIDPAQTFASFLRAVRQTTTAAFDHQIYPFDFLVSELPLKRDLSRSPLCDVLVVLQNQDERGRPIAGLSLRLFVEPSETAKLDLTFYFKALDDRLQGAIEYNTDLFAPDRIERFAGQFATLVDAVLAAPATPVGRLALLPATERAQLVEAFNRTAAPQEAGRTTIDLIEAQVARTPGAVALVSAGVALTFAELNARANQFASRLRELGVGRETPVGVCLERSIDLVVALLAVGKAGAAYVPLDPLFPRERLAYMLEDAGATVLVTEPAVGGDLAAPGIRVLAPTAERAALAARSPANGPAGAGPDNIAYLIYTSGSTGRPKGVPVLHRGLTNFLQSMAREPGLTAADTLLAVTTVSFDIAGLELWLPLITGARIVLADRATAADGAALKAALRTSGATVLQATPATWRLLLAAGWEGTEGLRMFCGGEALPGDLAAELLRRGAEVWNLYGPTETTVWSTVQRVRPVDTGPGVVPIGRPIANTQCHVLDAALQPVPIGVPGELHLGGAGVARGYWRRPELTAERFVPDPFAATPGAQLYKTGDRARWRADGTLEYLGRLDHQVKLRGYRIELGEIEAALALHPAVQAAAAVVRADASGEPALVAYVVPRGMAPEPAELRAFLRERLPDYMVPGGWATLAALPLTANGKVDRRALPAPEGAVRAAGAELVAPRDALEAALAAIWSNVLGVPQVGVTASFFDLGGHSLKATQVMARIRAELGLELSMLELFREPTIAALAARLRARAPSDPAAVVTMAESADGPAPLSAAQRRLWILEQLRPGTAAYNMAEALRIEGPLDVAALRAALVSLVARHESLRTCFQETDGEVQAIVRPVAEFALAEADVSAARAAEEAAGALAGGEVARPFDLRAGPLFRATLVRLSDEQHRLILVMHHIVSDAWSVGVIGRELAALYAGHRAGRPAALPPPGASYRDFAAWQRAELAGAIGAGHREYWLQQLGGERQVLALPTDAPRPGLMTAAGRTLVFRVEPALAAALTRLGRDAGATPFMTLLALVQALLHRYTGQEDIIVGSPVAGRDRVEWEGTVGFFVNTVALRNRVKRTESFSALLGRVRTTCLEGFAHQAYPFDRLVDDLKLERDLSRNPLFDVSLQLLTVARTELHLEGLRFTEFDHGQAPAKCDLSFDFTESAGGFTCALTYHADLFSAARMQRLAGHFQQLAVAIVAAPARPLGDHGLLTPAERRQIITEFNPPPAAPVHDTVTAWFDRVAARQPGHPALRFEGETWTYAELETRSNQLARLLRARGVAGEAVVAVMLERGPALPCALLAVLKAGGIYLPIDPALPAARIAAMLADSEAAVVITSRIHRGRVPAGPAVLEWEESAAERAAQAGAPPVDGPAPPDGAYLIYTSGSTGTPKGVLVEHRGLANTVADQIGRLGLGANDRVLQFASASFDASLFEIFNALLGGATLVLARRETLADPLTFLACLREQAVTVAVLPPSFVRSLDRAELPLRILFTAGEAAVPADARFYAARLTYVNGYGPTEASICSTVHFVSAEEATPFGVPIGRPLANTRAYLLDAGGQPVPVGVAGELWVGGAGVARGYWRRPDLTAERFGADPLADEPGARRYRTGDVGRWREDGAIEFFGRDDAQVKLRGYRIELGEIEAVLARCPGVREAVVRLREDAAGRPQLVGYYVPGAESAPAAEPLRALLRETLPDYMVPAILVPLADFPRTTAGKVDRRALPAPSFQPADAAIVAPRDEVERALAEVFSAVLHLERVGVHDSFFQLGGDSLLAIRVISKVRDLFQVELAVAVFFENASVAGLAAALRANDATRGPVEQVARRRAEAGCEAGPRLAPRPAGEPPVLSHAQQRLWFLQQLDPASAAYNIVVAVRLDGRLEPAALAAALNDLVARHEVLRMAFPVEDGRVAPRLDPAAQARLEFHDFAPLAAAERAAATARVQAEAAARPFELAQAPLLRLVVIRLGVTEHVAILVMHHLVSDAWSMDILVRELGAAYLARAAGRAPAWAALPLQYADFAAWQRGWLEAGVRAEQLDYWRRQLAQPPTLALPTDRPRPARPDFSGATLTFTLPDPVVAGVRGLARSEDATVFMVLLAAFQTLLHRYTDQDDLVVGAPVANRTRSELEPLIGFFVNTLVLRADFSARPDFRTLLRQVRRTALDAYGRQDLPFEDLVHELQPERHLSQNPLFQVMFSVQAVSRETLRLTDLVLTPLPATGATAKFDLTLALEESASGLSGALEYRTALFDEATMRRFVAQFEHLLAEIILAPTRPVATLPLQPAAQERALVDGWNATARPYPPRSVGELFAEQAARRPQASAVRCRAEQVSYAELNTRANRLAHWLQAHGVGPDVRVGVCVERSVDLIVALLGVIKAGGAYVALDPELPPARLALMLAEARGPVVLTQQRWRDRLPADAGAGTTLCLDRAAAVLAAQPATEPPSAVTLDHLAYVSYTSGSTGQPKGVAVPHRGIVRLVHTPNYATFTAADTFLQLAPVAFDASTLEIWAPLLNGAQLVVMPPGPPGLELLGRTIRDEGVTTLWLTAGLFHLMVDERLADLGGVRQLLAGGDVLSVPHVRKFLRAHPACHLINGYGPTENTTFTCCQRIAEADLAGGSVPIGRPITNTRVYLLDRALRPVPIGVPGELYTGGDGLARGYVDRPDLTAEMFVPDPFAAEGGGRLYRTGDRARWCADGTIQFLGRLDQQVKIRGYRIEPGEAEAALLAEPGVKAAAVIVDGAAGQKRLVGYAVSAHPGEELRARLQARLPDYLVPAVIVTLDALPLTANGKLDRAALPAPAAAAAETWVAPRNDLEREVARLWCAVLGRERAGVHDNYFASGGDSIGAIQLASRLQRAGWQIDVRDLFQFPTIAELAPRLRRPEAAPAEAEALAGAVPLTPAQAWFFAQHDAERHHFNQAVLLAPRTPLDAGAVAAVVTGLWRQHDALRTVCDGERASILAADTPAPFSEATVADEVERLAHSEGVQRAFDLARGPLFRTVLYRAPAGDRLLLVAHHLVIDGVSWRILLEDFELGLRQQAQGESVDFGPRSGSIRRWTTAAAARAEAGLPAAEMAYWSECATRETDAWPAIRSAAPNVFGAARTVAVSLPEAVTRTLLTTAHAAYHTETNDLLLVALGRALKRWHGGEVTRVTMEGHGRDPETALPAIERTVGWFTCLYPVVLAVAGDDLGAQLKRVKEDLREVPAKGVGHGLLAWLRPPAARPAWAAAAGARISFNYLGQFGEESGGRLAFADESPGAMLGPNVARAHELDASAAVVRGRLGLSLTFHPERVEPAAMEQLVADWRSELEGAIAHCAARTWTEKTPADFTSRLFSQTSYEAWLAARGWRAADVDDICRLSPMQAGLLFQAVFDDTSAAYFVQMAYRLRGRLDPERFAQAWGALSERHAILRTNIVHQGVDEPLQLVWKRRAPEVAVHDLSEVPPAAQAEHIAAARRADLARGFDLERDPLWRVTVWRLTADTFQVLWSYHHVLLDGWSLGLVHRDLLALYGAGMTGQVPALPAAMPYRDYVRWLATRNLAAARTFWAGYLEGYTQPAGLPRLRPPDGAEAMAAAEQLVDFGPEFSAAIRAVAAGAGVTLNILMQAAWGLVLARHNRADDVVFGTIVSGRPADLPGVEEMVGLFICAVPVRVQVADDVEFSAWLRAMQTAALAAEAHHHLPMTEIQTLTPLGRELFDHLLVFENYPMDRALGTGAKDGLRVEGVAAHDRTHYDLDVTVDPGATIAIKFAYNENVYPADQVARVAGHLRHVLEQVVARPSARVGEFELATPAEVRQVREEFNPPPTPWPSDRTLVDLLEAAAALWPERVAVVHGATTLTYRELHERANRLAHALRRRGVGPEAIVGLWVERSAAMIIGVLGILKAGGAYVPLDPLYPAERLAFMVRDAGARVVVTEPALRASLPATGADVLLLDFSAGELAAAPATPPPSGLRPENLAYLIYTSGSTGVPKGVMVEHRALVNAAVAWRTAYGLESADVRLLQMASLSFDVFAGDFIRALTNGGSLVICEAEARGDPAELCVLLARHRITLFESTPGLILPLMEHVRAQRVALPDLRLLIVGSDTLPAADYRRLVADFGATMRVVNSYGVTEAAIDSSYFEDRAGLVRAGLAAPIGRPLANMQLLVRDGRGQLCPIGVAGELFIGGEGLARGYFNRPELTAERFVRADVAGGPQRLYRTGDLARWLADGNVEFLGRGDQQVKVRGVRVEPGEIEARLRTHPAVREAIVLAREVQGANELVAYLVTEGTVAPADLRAHVIGELPESMAPAYWVMLERFPLSPNGKIDRRALPAPDAEARGRSAAYVAPRNATEETLAEIWREVLQVGRIGVEDNFFELGGHSLKAMQVVSRVQRACGVRPPLREFFAQATVAGLAALVARAAGGPADDLPAIPPAAPQEHYELSYAQQRLWLLHGLGGEAAYNMPEAYRLETAPDAAALEQALQWLVARHEALRTAFVEIDGEPRQRILPAVPLALRCVDLSGEPRAEERAREIADGEAAAPFDLTQPPLLRATLLTLAPRRTVFLFTMHHIIGDGWSGNVLYREVFALYAAARRGGTDPLPPLRIHYKDFAVWQKARGFARDEAHWRRQLAGVPEALALPYDFTPGAERDFRGDQGRAEIDAAVTAGLRRIARARQTTLSNVVLAVFELLLFQLTRQEDLCLGVSVANRHQPELESLIGFFVNILPVRTRLNAAMEFDDLLAQVIAAADDAFEHQDYPFDLLVQKVNPHRSTNRQPLVNVIYAFQNFADVHVEVAGAPAAAGGGGVEAELVPTQAFEHAFKTSKFDLTLFVTDDAGRLQLTLEYDTGLFRAETIRRYLGLLRRFAATVAASAPATG